MLSAAASSAGSVVTTVGGNHGVHYGGRTMSMRQDPGQREGTPGKLLQCQASRSATWQSGQRAARPPSGAGSGNEQRS